MKKLPPYITKTVTAVLVILVVGVCMLARTNPRASMIFGAAGIWMTANFVIWTCIILSALKPKHEESNSFVLISALGVKLLLLAGGIVALLRFKPYTKTELLSFLAGISIVIFVAFVRALGAKIVENRNRSVRAGEKDKQV